MTYQLLFTCEAEEDITILKKSEPQNYRKLVKLLCELADHPYMGTGKPERLKYDKAGLYSRKISSKHRLVYTIDEVKITVLIVAAYGHYSD